MRLSAAFLLRFFCWAAALFALWSFAGVGDGYSRAVLTAASPLMRVVTGFWVTEVRDKKGGVDVFIRAQSFEPTEKDEKVPFQPREQFSGLVPFLALMASSSWIPWRRRLRAAAIGIAAMFVFHIGLALIGPFMTGLPQAELGLVWMRRVNRMIDVIYGFYGLVGYAALPFLLWWLLTRQAPAANRA